MKGALLVLISTGLAAAQVTVVKNATILTVTKGTIENGSILIRDGKIAAVGKKVDTPAGATVIDATGQFVMPGIIDCHSHIATEAVNEGSISGVVHGRHRGRAQPRGHLYLPRAGGRRDDGQHPARQRQRHRRKDRRDQDALGQGRRRTALRKGAPRASSSPSARIPSARARAVRFSAPRTFAIRPRAWASRTSSARPSTKRKQYQAEWNDYRAKVANGEHPVPPRRDLKLEPLVEVLEGKRLVHAHCYRADEILMLLQVADEFGFKIRTLQHVLEGYKVAKEIAAHGAGASTFSDWWAYKMEAIDAIPYNAAIMARKGVLVTLNSDSEPS